MSTLSLVWYKRDLRVADHRPLAHASERGSVIAFYVDEVELWCQPDMSARHRACIGDALDGLARELAALGAPLHLHEGDIVDVLTRYHDACGEFTLLSHEETGNGWTFGRDRAVAAWCRERGIAWTEYPQNGVVRRLGSRAGWAQRWEARMREPLTDPPQWILPATAPSPTSSIDRFRARPAGFALHGTRQNGRREAGLRLLRSFLEERSRTYRYAISKPIESAEVCSRLSPYLTWGTLSLREVVHATHARLGALDLDTPEGLGRRKSLEAFLARLHWHCHFIQKLESEPQIEFRNMHRAYDALRDRGDDARLLDAWKTGMTGFPFVDAGMRALLATGWMNFRMRATLCSFASFQLWLHWRVPALHLARLFTDYEPGIHYSQMQMQSGTSGINTIRIYNPVKQGLDQDAHGRFVRRWCPEIRALPDAFVHAPWTAPHEVLEHAGIKLGVTYPVPIVDHELAARRAREAVWAVRRTREYDAQARAIVERHGSRTAGLPRTGERPLRKAVTRNITPPNPSLFDET